MDKPTTKEQERKTPSPAKGANVPLVTPPKEKKNCLNVHTVPCKSTATNVSDATSANPLILGPQWRVRNNQYTYVTIFLVGPPATFYRAHFRDQTEWYHYHRQMMTIKSTMDDIIAGPEDQRIERLFDTWIPMVNSFVKTWGKDFVTKDIRAALNDVENNLHLTTTFFPDFLTLSDLL